MLTREQRGDYTAMAHALDDDRIGVTFPAPVTLVRLRRGRDLPARVVAADLLATPGGRRVLFAALT